MQYAQRGEIFGCDLFRFIFCLFLLIFFKEIWWLMKLIWHMDYVEFECVVGLHFSFIAKKKAVNCNINYFSHWTDSF